MEVNAVEANKAVIRYMVECNDSQRFYDYIDNVAEDFVGHNALVPAGMYGKKSLSDYFYGFEGIAIPDGKHIIHNLFGEDNLVAMEVSFVGTFTGPLAGMPPNGAHVDFRYNILCRFDDDQKLAEIWWYSQDSVKVLQDLGMLPAFE